MALKLTKKRAFSLVELVIVVVIIGVIAAIAVPRMSRGAKGAGESALKGNLTTIRKAIDMYAAEHGGTFPGSDGVDTTFIDHLTSKTDAAGNVGTTAGTHIYGPYLRNGLPPVPVGPNVGATGVIMTTSAPITGAVLETTTTAGWVYNYETGDFIANTDDAAENGSTYDSF